MEKNIQENGKQIEDMVKEYFSGQMEGNTQGNLRMTKKVEWVHCLLVMIANMLVNGKVINSMEKDRFI